MDPIHRIPGRSFRTEADVLVPGCVGTNSRRRWDSSRTERRTGTPACDVGYIRVGIRISGLFCTGP